MKSINLKKLILPNLPYLLFVYLFDKVGQAVRLAPGADLSGKLLTIGDGFAAAFSSFAPSLHPADLLVGILGAALIRLIVYVKGKNAKKYRRGVEYGSARWGSADDIRPYIDPVFENNVLLTQTERLMMNSRPKQPKYARNKNVLVVGGSGSGKTRFFVKPNLMQMHSSYLVSDPKGTLLLECGKLLERGSPKLGEDGKPVRKNGKLVYEPYRIKVLNTINFKKSMKYNPFAYLRDEKDILKLVNTLIANTKGSGEKSGEDFWVKAERLLYCALIGYIHYEAPDAERNFTTLLEMINASEAREDDSEFQSPVDLMFERLEEKDPEHFAVKQYKKFLLSAGKTRSSILISCGARLAPFDIKELRELMESDELELDTLGDRKTALFIITSDTDPTFDFVTAMIVSQLFNLLCTKADDEYGGRLPVHVRCLLDEVANITIPNLERLISVLRSREISACLVVQAQSQLKAIYKEHADTIIGNCDTTLFLGGKEKTTLKEIKGIPVIAVLPFSQQKASFQRGDCPAFYHKVFRFQPDIGRYHQIIQRLRRRVHSLDAVNQRAAFHRHLAGILLHKRMRTGKPRLHGKIHQNFPVLWILYLQAYVCAAVLTAQAVAFFVLPCPAVPAPDSSVSDPGRDPQMQGKAAAGF